MEKLTKEEKKQQLIDSTRNIVVNTLNKNKELQKVTLYYLCFVIGVKLKVEYFNMVEKLLPKKERTIHNTTYIKRVVHDRGLIFNNDFEIRHVESKIFKLFDCETIEKRERL